MRILTVTLTMAVPDEAINDDVAEYVEDAVGSWKGSLRPPGAYGPHDPGDPMFELDQKNVTVNGVRRGLKRRLAQHYGDDS